MPAVAYCDSTSALGRGSKHGSLGCCDVFGSNKQRGSWHVWRVLVEDIVATKPDVLAANDALLSW